MKVRELMSEYLAGRQSSVELSNLYLVYLGKALNPANTLGEEFIEDGCEVIMVEHKPKPRNYAIEHSESYHMAEKSEATE